MAAAIRPRHGKLERGEMLEWVYNTSPWVSSLAFILSGIVVSAIAVLVLTHLVRAETRRAHNEFISFTVTNIAVVYAVLLAFIGVAAWEDLSKASDLVATEAGVVQNLYIDAEGFTDKAVASAVRDELRRYIRAVLDREWPEQQAGGISRAGFPALRQLRATLASLKPQTQGDAIVMQESLRSLNDLFTARRSRIDAAGAHIPDAVWWVVLFLGLLTVGFTALLGMDSLWMHFAVTAGLTTAMVVVIALIVQLDYPFRGTISVSSEPFERIIPSLGTEPGGDLPAAAQH